MPDAEVERLEAEAAPHLDAILDDRPGPPGDRPRTIGVMVTAANGWSTYHGGSGGLTNGEDRGVFRGLRERADAILVGSGTLNDERYSTVLDDHQRERRVAAGRSPEPLVATVTRGLSLDPGVPIVAAPENELVVYTASDDAFAGEGDHHEVVRVDELTYAGALADLGRRGARTVGCEGGPSTLARLVAEDLLDDLVLTLSPILVPGDDPITAVTGDFGPAVELELRRTWTQGSTAFLHYRLVGRATS